MNICFAVLLSVLWHWRRRPTPCRRTRLTGGQRRKGWRTPVRETPCWDLQGRLRSKTASSRWKSFENKSSFWDLKKKSHSNLPEKGNTTKLECSTTETAKHIDTEHSTGFCHSFSFSTTLSTSGTTQCLYKSVIMHLLEATPI